MVTTRSNSFITRNPPGRAAPRRHSAPVALSLAELCDVLNGAAPKLSVSAAEDLLARVRPTPAEIRAVVRFAGVTSRPHVVCRRDSYELLVCGWRPGQHSPVHDHCRSRCTLAVLAGVALEVRFQRDAAQRLQAVSYRPLPTGTVTSVADDEVHVIANWTQPHDNLVTIHLHRPPVADVHTCRNAEVVPVPFERLRALDPPPPRYPALDAPRAAHRPRRKS